MRRLNIMRQEADYTGLLGRGVFDRAILRAALEFRAARQNELFALARDARDKAFPEKTVEARSVIEISNICRQRCRYCNMSHGSGGERFVMPLEQFDGIVAAAYRNGRRVLLVQSGQNPDDAYVEHVSQCVSSVKRRFPDLAVMLSLGMLSRKHYETLKEAGAERYILKFETSNAGLYSVMKRKEALEDRLDHIRLLLEVGFKVGTGSIAGLPGQTLDDIVGDLILTHQLPVQMMSVSVFIPGERSALATARPGEIDCALNAMALMRIMRPQRLMPSTSSLEKSGGGGQLRGLLAGANTVTVHDATPESLKPLFPIYSVQRVTPQERQLARAVKLAGLEMSREPLCV